MRPFRLSRLAANARRTVVLTFIAAFFALFPLAARGESLAAFDGRRILAGCVAPPSNIPDILGRRAWPARRLARLGATPDFHHGLLAHPASGATIAGTVTDPDGRGVPAVRVILTSTLGTVAAAETGTDGAYEITGLRAGQFILLAIADGFQSDPIGVTLSADDRRDIGVRLRLSAITESVVVSASQIGAPLSRAASGISVVTEAELRARQIVTVADALRVVPGLSVARSGGQGALTSLFPRGGGSNYTLVLVDGMRVNAFGGGFDFGHLSAAGVERIEIARGAQSSIFGSDAIGGVVQIITKRGGRPRAEARIEGGSQGTARTTVDATGATGAWTWGGGAERARSDGYTGAAANGENVGNDDDRLARATGTLGWQRPGGLDVLVTGNISRDERGYPGPFGADPSRYYSGVDRVSRGLNDTGQVGARLVHPWSSRVRQRLEASFTELSTDFTSPYGPSAGGSRRFDSRIQEDIALFSTFSASAGLELIREQGTSTYVTGEAGREIPVERGMIGVFTEGRVAWRDRLFVTGGLRLDHVSRQALEADPLAFQPRPAFAEQTIDSVNPKIAVNYLLTPPGETRSTTRLRASAGTGIRPPNVFEIAFTDNPGLQPERSRSVDLGIEQQLAGGAVVIAATGFFNQYDDLIVTVGRAIGGASRYRTDNVSNARARGLELSTDARLPVGLAIHTAYTFLDSEILSTDGVQAAPAPFNVGDALIRRPRHQGAFHVTYARSGLATFVEVLGRGKTLDLEPNFAGTTYVCPGYAVLNAGAGFDMTRNLQVFVRGLNLTDREYEETLGYPARRRSGIVGVRIAAGR